jgi:hypothetical protein
MLIRPTAWSIKSPDLCDWVLETSLDNWHWTEIDRYTKPSPSDFFPLPPEEPDENVELDECHFIRLAQTGRNGRGNDELVIQAFEVFGTIFE